MAHSVVAAWRDQTRSGERYSPVVFVDDKPAASAPLPVVPFDNLRHGDQFIIGVSDGQTRRRLERKCVEAGLEAFDFQAPGVTIGLDNRIDSGCVLMADSMITSNVRIGRQFQCNIYSYVEHDCVIGDYVTFAPRVSCNGNVHIEDYAYIGAGAVIKQGTPDRPLTIGKGAVVGMGAIVVHDVAPGAVVTGNPARPLKRS